MSKNIPSWLLNLAPGEYTMSELMKLTGHTRANLHKVLMKYGAKVKQEKKLNSNLTYYIYIWEGYTK